MEKTRSEKQREKDRKERDSHSLIICPDCLFIKKIICHFYSEHGLIVCLVGFLRSSSTTRLYHGRVPRLTSDNFCAATHETERGDHDFCRSRSHSEHGSLLYSNTYFTLLYFTRPLADWLVSYTLLSCALITP